MRLLQPSQIVKLLRGRESQKSFALRLKIHKNSLSRIERGERPVSLKIARRLVQIDSTYSLEDFLGKPVVSNSQSLEEALA